MTLQLNLPPKLHERLRQEAERRGEAVEAAALRLLDERLPPLMLPPEERHAALLALFQQWEKEDAALTPEEVASYDEVLRALDEHRPHRKLFTDIVKDEPK